MHGDLGARKRRQHSEEGLCGGGVEADIRAYGAVVGARREGAERLQYLLCLRSITTETFGESPLC